MNRTASYREVLSYPVRKTIIQSILSRENASRVAEIVSSTGLQRSRVHHHLDILLAAGILMSDYDISDIDRRGRNVYFISYQDESLQDVLREMFPELMSVGPS